MSRPPLPDAPVPALPVGLQEVRRVVAVVAHPDDESFGLGGVIGLLVDHGMTVDVLCLSQGEASTLGVGTGQVAAADLKTVRAGELRAAAAVLGVDRVWLHDLPDGNLAGSGDRVAAAVEAAVAGADAVVVFEPSGVTGHPDHMAATAAALLAARRWGMVTIEWGVPPAAAEQMADELGVPFTGLSGVGVVAVHVDRVRQRAAAALHATQATANPVLERRLAVQGDIDHLRISVPEVGAAGGIAPCGPVTTEEGRTALVRRPAADDAHGGGVAR